MTVHTHQMTRAEHLCAQYELDFAEVFSQQFRVEKGDARPLPGFALHRLGHWHVQVAAGLPSAVAETQQGTHVALLGVAVDANGDVVTKQHLSRQTSADDLITYLNACAGRFVFIVVTSQFSRLYGDAVGSLGAVYDPQDGCIASTINLVLTREVVENDDYPLAALASHAKARFAFGHTADKYVKRLLPNHYLDMEALTQHRFWDGQGDITDIAPSDTPAVIDQIADRLTQVMAGLATYFPDTKLPITGGLDSRVLLSCAEPFVDKLFLYSHAENMMGRRDTRIAGRLAQILDQPMAVYDPGRDPDYAIDDAVRLMTLSNASQIANGEGVLGTQISQVRLEVLQAPPRGGIVMRGNAGELMRAMLWRRAIVEYKNNTTHDVQTGLRMMMLTDNEMLKDLNPTDRDKLMQDYNAWYADFSGTPAKRVFDLLFIEHFLSHGQGNHFYAFTHNFYLYPYCDRKVLSLITSLPRITVQNCAIQRRSSRRVRQSCVT